MNTHKNNPNIFCYICGEVTFSDRKANITSFVKETYLSYYGMPLVDQDKEFAPHICCKTCEQQLRIWKSN